MKNIKFELTMIKRSLLKSTAVLIVVSMCAGLVPFKRLVKADGLWNGRDLYYAVKDNFEKAKEYIDIDTQFGRMNGDSFEKDYNHPEWVKITYEINRINTRWWVRQFHWFTLPENLEQFSKIVYEKKSRQGASYQKLGEFTTKDWPHNQRYYAFKDDNANKFMSEWNKMTGEDWYTDHAKTQWKTKEFREHITGIFMSWERLGRGSTRFTVYAKIKDRKKDIYLMAGIHQVAGGLRYNLGKQVKIPEPIKMSVEYEPVYPELTAVKDTQALTSDEQNTVKDKLFNAQSETFKQQLKNGKDSIKIAADGSATITYKDDSEDKIVGTSLVVRKVGVNELITPTVPAVTGVKDLANVDTNEQNQIRDKIWQANEKDPEFKKHVPDKNKITVDKTGKATITYDDGTTDEIQANELVFKKTTLADEITPWIGLPVGVKNANNVEQGERTQVQGVIYGVNSDNTKFIQNLKNGMNSIAVDEKGKVTITYKDDSTDTIDPSLTIYQIPPLSEQLNPNVPARMGVDNAKQLSQEEQTALQKSLFQANTDIQDKIKDGENGISIAEDGTATITYTDDSKDTIPGRRLVYEKAKGGGAVNPTTEDQTNGEYKYKVTAIVVDDANNPNDNNYADAVRRFLFDNYTWDGKHSDFETGKHQSPLSEIGGYIASAHKWDNTTGATGIKQMASKYNFKPNADTQNIELQSKIEEISIDTTSKCIVFKRLENWNTVPAFMIPKDQLFVSNGKVFDKEKVKEEADKIIDDMVQNGDLSEDEANKLKKEIEDNGNDQDKINEVIKKAEDESKKEKEKKQKEAEQKREEEGKKKKEESKQNAQKEEADRKQKQKDDAKKLIDGMSGLSEEEKNKKKQEIDNADDAEKIRKIVDDAKQDDQKGKDKKAKDEALKKAKDEADKAIDNMKHLSDQEKAEFKQQVKDADSQEKVKKALEDAQKKDAENAQKLIDKKKEAQKEIDELNELTKEEREKAKEEIDQAGTEEDIKKAKEKAKDADTEKGKESAKKSLDDKLPTDKKQEAENDIDTANSADEAHKKADKANLNGAKEAAKEEVDKLDKLTNDEKNKYKQEIDAVSDNGDVATATKKVWDKYHEAELENAKRKAKEEINKIGDLSDAEKQEFLKQVDEAQRAGDVEAIVELAKLQGTKNKAKSEIDKLKYLNDAQKQAAKEAIDEAESPDKVQGETENNLQKDKAVIDEILKTAKELDKSMHKLKQAKKAADEIAKGLTGTDDKTNKFKASIKEAEELLDKTKGTNKDKTEVDALIERLKKEAEELGKNLEIKLDTEDLEQEVKTSSQIKEADPEKNPLYQGSHADTKQAFDQALQEAKTLLDAIKGGATDKTQEAVNEAYEKLKKAREALDGDKRHALKQKADEASQVKTSPKYTAETDNGKKQALDEALTNATNLINDKNATKEQLEEAKQKLDKAIKALTGKTQAESTEPRLLDEKVWVGNSNNLTAEDIAEVKTKLAEQNQDKGITADMISYNATSKKFIITYPDNTDNFPSKDEISADDLVRTVPQVLPISPKLKVKNMKQLSDVEKQELIVELLAKNPNKGLVAGMITIDEANQKVIVKFSERYKQTLAFNDLLKQSSMADEHPLVLPRPKVTVDNKNSLTEREKDEVIEAVLEANKGTGLVKVEIDKEFVVATYADGSVNVLLVEEVVSERESFVESISEYWERMVGRYLKAKPGHVAKTGEMAANASGLSLLLLAVAFLNSKRKH